MKNILIALSFAMIVTGCASPSLPAGTRTFTVTSETAPTSYTINGVENPTIVVKKGQTYTFQISATGHPFYIMSVSGINPANAFTTGVTGNGTQSGSLVFTVPITAPPTLFYDCSVHSAMGGTILVSN